MLDANSRHIIQDRLTRKGDRADPSLRTFILAGQEIPQRHAKRRGRALARILQPDDLIIFETQQLTETTLERFRVGLMHGGPVPMDRIHLAYAPLLSREQVGKGAGPIAGHRLICGDEPAALRAQQIYRQVFDGTAVFEGLDLAQREVVADLQKTMGRVDAQGQLRADGGG